MSRDMDKAWDLAQSMIAQQTHELESLRAQLAAAQRDGARLDWLESERPIVSLQAIGTPCALTTVVGGLKSYAGKDVRSAIDAAMQPLTDAIPASGEQVGQAEPGV